jgi:hypothetical protein
MKKKIIEKKRLKMRKFPMVWREAVMRRKKIIIEGLNHNKKIRVRRVKRVRKVSKISKK